MREYLIRATDGSGWIPVRQERLSSVLVPNKRHARLVEGWGEVRFSLAGIEFSFSGEEVGWQVAVEGETNADLADAVIGEISDQLRLESGQEATWSVITE